MLAATTPPLAHHVQTTTIRRQSARSRFRHSLPATNRVRARRQSDNQPPSPLQKLPLQTPASSSTNAPRRCRPSLSPALVRLRSEAAATRLITTISLHATLRASLLRC